jgi:hypothetical protein
MKIYVLCDLLMSLLNEKVLAFKVYIVENVFKTGVHNFRAPSRRGDKFCKVAPNTLSIITAVVFLTHNKIGNVRITLH